MTAMVTLASPLAANMPLTQVTPLAFSLSDGVQTFNDPIFNEYTFLFATGPSGNITNWRLDVSDSLEVNGIETRNDAFEVRDIGVNFADLGENFGHPGHWRSAAPDAGSSLALLSLSLTALGAAARQFKRAAT